MDGRAFMTKLKLRISILPDTFAICQLDKDAPIPDWAKGGCFLSITRTPGELSIVCPQILVPKGIRGEEGWRCLKVEGPLDFSATGVLASLLVPLAREGISVFVISTYDTDYLLVKEENLGKAIMLLWQEGHEFTPCLPSPSMGEGIGGGE